jgi:hypothetical protein
MSIHVYGRGILGKVRLEEEEDGCRRYESLGPFITDFLGMQLKKFLICYV